jgi:hypothetical protein
MAPFVVAAAVRISSTSWLITWVARRMSSAMGRAARFSMPSACSLGKCGEVDVLQL